jgi:cell division septal protein FtsQ
MAHRRKTTSRNTKSIKVSRGRRSSRSRTADQGVAVARVALPLLVIVVLVSALGLVGFFGYKSVTNSKFFDLRDVDVRGTSRTSQDDVKRTVVGSLERSGLWDADLGSIKSKIEKFPFVKSASVSVDLPSKIRVNVTERIPAAIVHTTTGNYLVDSEAAVLAPVGPADKEFPFVLRGWDESKTEKAIPDNVARLKMYRRMLDEWKQFDLTSRVKEVNLVNVREPVAVVEDSGRSITISLAKDNMGKSLKTAIEAISGKGSRIISVDAAGVYPIMQFRDQN